MILNEPTALRCAKMMRLQVPPSPASNALMTLGEQKFSYKSYSGSGLCEVTKLHWQQDGDSTSPYNILLRVERADAQSSTEYYTTWAGFVQAYHIKPEWRDL